MNEMGILVEVDCLKDDIKGVSMEITSGRREWKKKTCCADPTWWDKGTMTMSIIFKFRRNIYTQTQ
jgi:hypothetical protein